MEMKIRNINVHGTDCEVYEQEVVDWLFKRKVIYDCGDGHDLHLDPDHEFLLEEVEVLLSNELPENWTG